MVDEVKISDLDQVTEALDDDLFETSEPDGVGGWVSKKISRSQIVENYAVTEVEIKSTTALDATYFGKRVKCSPELVSNITITMPTEIEENLGKTIQFYNSAETNGSTTITGGTPDQYVKRVLGINDFVEYMAVDKSYDGSGSFGYTSTVEKLTPVCFSVFQNAVQTVASATPVKVVFDTVIYNDFETFDIISSSHDASGLPGYWEFDIILTMEAPAAVTQVELAFFINGSQVSDSYYTSIPIGVLSTANVHYEQYFDGLVHAENIMELRITQTNASGSLDILTASWFGKRTARGSN